CEGEIKEKRLARLLGDKLQRLLGEQVVRIYALLRRDALLDDVAERDLFLVAPQVVGIVVVRVDLVEVAEEVVKPLAVGDAGAARLPQTPLADETRAVAGPLEHLGHGGVLGPQRHQRVAANLGVPGVPARHQTTAGWRADGAAGVALRESNTVGGELVEVWRQNLLLPVAAEIAVPQIVGKYQNNVWYTRLFRTFRLIRVED